jgi:hypothetical protein
MIYRIKEIFLSGRANLRVFLNAFGRADAVAFAGIFGLMILALWLQEASNLVIWGMAVVCCLPFAVVGFRFFVGTVVFVLGLVGLKAFLGIPVFEVIEFGHGLALMWAGHLAAGFGISPQVSGADREAVESLSIVLAKTSISGLMLGMAFRGMLLEKRPL